MLYADPFDSKGKRDQIHAHTYWFIKLKDIKKANSIQLPTADPFSI